MKCSYEGEKLVNEFEKLNSSISKSIKKIWKKQTDYMLTFSSLIGVFLIFSNLAVIFGIIKTNRELKTPQKLFILSSICGFVVGLSTPFLIYAAIFIESSCLFEAITTYIVDMLWLFESNILITNSITRLISVKWPLYDIEWRTVKRILTVEVILTLCSLGALSFFNEKSRSFWLFIGTLLLSVTIIMSILALLSIYCLLKRPRIIGANATNQNQARMDFNRIWKPIIRIVPIQIAYILCNLPFAILCMMVKPVHPSNATQTAYQQFAETEIDLYWMVILSELYNGINACLYMAQCKEIRQFYARTIFRRNLRVHPEQQRQNAATAEKGQNAATVKKGHLDQEAGPSSNQYEQRNLENSSNSRTAKAKSKARKHRNNKIHPIQEEPNEKKPSSLENISERNSPTENGFEKNEAPDQASRNTTDENSLGYQTEAISKHSTPKHIKVQPIQETSQV